MIRIKATIGTWYEETSTVDPWRGPVPKPYRKLNVFSASHRAWMSVMNYLSQFNNSLKQSRWQIAKEVLRCTCRTRKINVQYCACAPLDGMLHGCKLKRGWNRQTWEHLRLHVVKGRCLLEINKTMPSGTLSLRIWVWCPDGRDEGRRVRARISRVLHCRTMALS